MRRTRIWGLVAAAVLCGSATSTPAKADPGSAPVIDITADDDGFTAPASYTSGTTSFRVNTSATGDRGTIIGLARLRPGATPAGFADHLGKVFSDDPKVAVPAGRALMAEAELLGGAESQAGRSTTFTTMVRPGTYYLLNYLDFETRTPAGPQALHKLTITRERHTGSAPRPGSVVGMTDTPSGPRFHLPDQIKAGAPLLLTNHLKQVNEAIFIPVSPDTSRAEIQKFFEGVQNGEWGRPPFTGAPLGSPPLSPGRTLTLQAPLKPGRYAVITWVLDLTDGVRLAAKGMHSLIIVT
ncbi:hypothetical protein [Actinomadura verrucosospora]|uniref:Putative secreted protein n=1 Tax=Actinomadura verrucosospora TaxID=46165 RepID=A0A7D3ZR75_ACTVE|nr:hypothetical protein [Actinomadura verrucosospora]QKG27221.1 putative secreted protein [Actinomadura verrucosospora]